MSIHKYQVYIILQQHTHITHPNYCKAKLTADAFSSVISSVSVQGHTPQTTAALTRLKPVWNDRSISHSSKIRLMRSLVTSIFLYACESWIVTAELQRRIQAMETRCYRKIIYISCKDHVTNEEVRAKIQQAIGDANCSGMVMSPVHQVRPEPFCKAQ